MNARSPSTRPWPRTSGQTEYRAAACHWSFADIPRRLTERYGRAAIIKVLQRLVATWLELVGEIECHQNHSER